MTEVMLSYSIDHIPINSILKQDNDQNTQIESRN